MLFTDVLNLPCPESTDYANLANYMQSLAEAIEAKIVAQRATMTAVDTQPVAIFRNSSQLGPISSSSSVSFLDLDTPVFRNYSIPGRFGGIPDFTYTGGSLFPRSGLYMVGFMVTVNNTGAVLAGSRRKVYFRVIKNTTTGTYVELLNITSEVIAATTSEGFGNCGVVSISDQDLSQVGVLMGFRHNDTTSTIQINSGNFIGFIQRIGSTDLIKVA